MTSPTPALFEPITVKPEWITLSLLLSALAPLSHHDPAVQDDSNVQLFNRQKQLVALPPLLYRPLPEQVSAFCERHPFPADQAELLADLTFPQFVAIAITRLFLDVHNARGGKVFDGKERYEILRTRLRAAATRSTTLAGAWNRLCDDLVVPMSPMDSDSLLLGFFALPRGLQALALRACLWDGYSIVAIARQWHDAIKRSNPEYRAKSGGEDPSEFLCPAFTSDDTPESNAGVIDVELPGVSNNSLRHQIVRQPIWLHLCGALGFQEKSPGYGDLPPGVEALFVNGGNIAAGAKQPENSAGLAVRARERFPSLDLLGGVSDSFDLGESRLKVAGWLVCRENRAALRGSLAYDCPNALVSALEMLDDRTETRQATRHGLGQMIRNFEVLAPGVQIFCRLALSPYTPTITQSTLAAAVATFAAGFSTIGGQSARGYGLTQVSVLTPLPVSPEEYECYLAQNKADLRDDLMSGTLGNSQKVVS